MTVDHPCEACEGLRYGPNGEHCSACDATGWGRPKIRIDPMPASERPHGQRNPAMNAVEKAAQTLLDRAFTYEGFETLQVHAADIEALREALDAASAGSVTEAVREIVVWNDHPDRPEYGRVTLRNPSTQFVMTVVDGLNRAEDKEAGLCVVREFLTAALLAALEVQHGK